MTAMDPPPLAGEFTPPLEEPGCGARRRGAGRRHRLPRPVRHTRASAAHLLRHLLYVCLLECLCGVALHRRVPASLEVPGCAPARQLLHLHDLLDPIGGYILPADFFFKPRVRHAAFFCRDCRRPGQRSPFGRQIFGRRAATSQHGATDCGNRGCSIKEATEITVRFIIDLVHDFRERYQKLHTVPNVELQRFLRGLRGWMGGAFQWHNSNPRYKNSNGTPPLDSQSST